MIDTYLEPFQRLMTEAAAGGTRHTELGTFPTRRDAERFRERAGLGARLRRSARPSR